MDATKSGDKFGLNAADLAYFNSAFAALPEIESVLIFGSRALGNFKNGSDIDFCLKGLEVDSRTCSELRDSLEELPIPYLFDIVNYNSLLNAELKDHIDLLGKVIYNSPN